jgi:hypothetical protein
MAAEATTTHNGESETVPKRASGESRTALMSIGADLLSQAAGLSKFLRLQVAAFDVNIGAAYTVYNTSTGAKIGTLGEVNSGDGQTFDGDGKLLSNFTMSQAPQQVTIKDSLGSSVTVPVTIVRPYG